MTKPRVLLGMSGGVDSSVSAVLLLEQGYEVIGGFMKNWSPSTLQDAQGRPEDIQGATGSGPSANQECDWRTERRDAMRVAARLGIPFHTLDFEEEYRRRVYEYMIAEYKAGRTPNPDVRCNKYMKFDLFLRKADELGCEFVATGHYARVQCDEAGTHLLAGVDANKDQSYFLCQLTQDQLRRAIFPVGEMTKPEVRAKAREANLPVADKKDSQGICFVGKVDMRDFLAARIEPHEGSIVTTDGRVIGTHKGFEFYTIGQREGLGVGGGTPFYVVERRPETNEVVVAIGDEDPALFRSQLRATNLTETIDGNLAKYYGRRISARIRYRQPLAACTLTPSGPLGRSPSGHSPTGGPATGEAHVVFDTPQRAVAPGQFIAFYDGEELFGSGVIASTNA